MRTGTWFGEYRYGPSPPYFFKRLLYTEPCWKIKQFLFRQETAKEINVPRGIFSNHFMEIDFFSQFHRLGSTTLQIAYDV